MNYIVLIDGFMIVICSAVLIQSARMMRSLKAMRDAGMQEMITALDRSTSEARAVLDGLKIALASDINSCNVIVGKAVELREELAVMTGIANAVAERIVDAVGQSKQEQAESGAADARQDMVL